jgi:hypothetical protein
LLAGVGNLRFLEKERPNNSVFVTEPADVSTVIKHVKEWKKAAESTVVVVVEYIKKEKCKDSN